MADFGQGAGLAAAAEGGRLVDHVTVFRPPATVGIPPHTPKLPIIAVPTTASGAEADRPPACVTATATSACSGTAGVSAAAILIDPLMSQDVPLPTLRYTAMNGIAHCLEGLYSKGRSSLSGRPGRAGRGPVPAGLGHHPCRRKPRSAG